MPELQGNVRAEEQALKIQRETNETWEKEKEGLQNAHVERFPPERESLWDLITCHCFSIDNADPRPITDKFGPETPTSARSEAVLPSGALPPNQVVLSSDV